MRPATIAALPFRPCVGVMLVNAEGRVFVGQRIDRDQDAWQMPQGGIDAGEDARAAALRELLEETGITEDKVDIVAQTEEPLRYDLPTEVVPHIWGGRFRGQAQFWVLMRFHGDERDINIATAHPEFSAWKWIEPSELPGAIVPFKRHVYEQVLERLGPLI
ncbi:RNA pyrophosphohydrolase [Limimaricola pyoseonensis]|uniref:RNA pyrophosphohydrolase n=1 Tax=Limimaricola pyoseonensis TaxID=521013 RepID=A0A1G7EFW6_9RHOB|nr:RNA pyrophosphohydrolase [Limimaricola pyoseonensis]SDE62570.1 putative (di)nucleoside polyphosphate hydrolase [Limimaricola pyoseonensis]